jgi:hypothetical protein
MPPCTGTLLYFPVPPDDRFTTEAAIVLCSDCGFVTTTGGALDERHADSQVVPVD